MAVEVYSPQLPYAVSDATPGEAGSTEKGGNGAPENKTGTENSESQIESEKTEDGANNETGGGDDVSGGGENASGGENDASGGGENASGGENDASSGEDNGAGGGENTADGGEGASSEGENEPDVEKSPETENAAIQSQGETSSGKEENENTDEENAAGDKNAAAEAGSASEEDEGVEEETEPAREVALMQDYNYLLNNFFSLDPSAGVDETLINYDQLMGTNLAIEKDASKPQILIYHTHSQEEFADSVEGDVSTTIVGAGEYLAELLRNRYGYNVIHDTGVYDMVDGVLDRSAAYDLAGEAVSRILEENPSIEVVIDLHRDGVPEHKFVTEINGKPTAQIMFFNGLSRTARNGPVDYLPNPYIADNLAFSFQLQLLADQQYPDFTRPIYLQSLRYNLHFRPRSLLIEAGTQLNTVAEEYNAMEPLADILNQVLQPE
ncbi:MAG TPA: stage II sporulation protein P [Candidatus Limivivens intestinipullorum]|uniref:Stage II sporulation protein P n=1 Tax=Candidatus Limivivens intestinipullorum TaxID=2840858 RepID=A0A9D1EQG2_9FIRM|nr:stage II sporulation protein P [Candidatus Limivivens intestinipullorum]